MFGSKLQFGVSSASLDFYWSIGASIYLWDQFERYLYQLKDQVTDEKKLSGKLSDDEKKAILKAVEEADKWSNAHKDSASKEDFEEQRAKVEKIVAPIMTKLYEANPAGAAEDAGAVEDKDEL